MKKLIVLFFIFHSVFIQAQDFIYQTDGTEIKSKVIEITPEFIKYKNFDQLNGPIRNIAILDVFMIIYEDGTKEVFKKLPEY